jgi:ribosome-associated protein
VKSSRFDLARLSPWIELRFTRSAGPGGQNVNKLSTRAELLFDFESCGLLRASEKESVRARLARRLAADGRLRIISQQGRTQSANRAAAEERLIELLRLGTHVPRVRRATRPTPGSKVRRLESKRARGEVKRSRQRGAEHE